MFSEREIGRKRIEEELMKSLIMLEYKKGFTSYEQRQLLRVLQQQFTGGNSAEVGGGLFFQEEGLEFRIVKTQQQQDVERALDQFVTGDFSSLEILLPYAEAQTQRIIDQVGEQHWQTRELQSVCHFLATATSDNEELRKHLRSLYELYILGTVYTFTPVEIGYTEKNFLGSFHVHPSGNPPSLKDQEVSKKLLFPAMVIAARQDFLETGFTLYLVHSQGYEQLYQGLFPSEENIKP
ncbi:MAG: hypothetical protein Q8R53_01490 [Nanoarchaeota archaeon]|nr:hypothetical protein [Nanoarchaeota archaeon]